VDKHIFYVARLIEASEALGEAFDRDRQPPITSHQPTFVDAHCLISNLSIQGQRLFRQFQKSLDTLRDLQACRADPSGSLP